MEWVLELIEGLIEAIGSFLEIPWAESRGKPRGRL